MKKLTEEHKELIKSVYLLEKLNQSNKEAEELRRHLRDCDKTLDFFEQIGRKEKERWKGTDFDGPWNAILGCCSERRKHIEPFLKQ